MNSKKEFEVDDDALMSEFGTVDWEEEDLDEDILLQEFGDPLLTSGG